jgi:hypothetical protein
MNYLVFLDPCAGELEKILSGIKKMLVKEFEPEHKKGSVVSSGDSLYFLRDKDEHNLRVKANVVRVLVIQNDLENDIALTLKELQPKLQLTEDQYNYWSAKKEVLLVEFNSSHKIAGIHVASNKITDRSDWIPFEEFCQITKSEVSNEQQTSTPKIRSDRERS